MSHESANEALSLSASSFVVAMCHTAPDPGSDVQFDARRMEFDPFVYSVVKLISEGKAGDKAGLLILKLSCLILKKRVASIFSAVQSFLEHLLSLICNMPEEVVE